jgi:hypothetical protein
MNSWSQGQTYAATKERMADIRETSLNGVRDWNAIAISGKVVDTIKFLSKTERTIPPNEDGLFDGELDVKRQHSWYFEMRDMTEEHIPALYRTGQPKDEALWRTMIGDHGLDGVRPAPQEYGDHYRLWQCILADFDHFIACCKQDIIPPGFKNGQDLVDMTVRYTRFNSVVGSFNSKRQFCITENRYIGMVPPGTQLGDRVCILLGTDTPFVIRKAPEPDEELLSYQLVGDCYVHGLMDGEGLDSPGTEEHIILR